MELSGIVKPSEMTFTFGTETDLREVGSSWPNDLDFDRFFMKRRPKSPEANLGEVRVDGCDGPGSSVTGEAEVGELAKYPSACKSASCSPPGSPADLLRTGMRANLCIMWLNVEPRGRGRGILDEEAEAG